MNDIGKPRGLCHFGIACLVLSLGLTPLPGALLEEGFSSDPMGRGWKVHGQSSLFQWNSVEEDLAVTWDSSQANSYFYHPLGTVLGPDDDFSATFDLVLEDLMIGVTTNKPFTFEVALGFIDLASATNQSFFRGTASGVKNLVEFDYFPGFSSFGATVALTVVSSNHVWEFSHNFPLELDLDVPFHVVMTYTGSTRELDTQMTRAGVPFGDLERVVLAESFPDFRLDAFAVSSYSDENSNGSILAQGRVDNLSLTFPSPPLGSIQGQWMAGQWAVHFESRLGWRYHLEKSMNLKFWEETGEGMAGTGMRMTLVDPQTGALGFYRVRAERP